MSANVKWVLFNLDSAIEHERVQAIVQAGSCNDSRVIQALASIAKSDPSMEHRHLAKRSLLQIRERLGPSFNGGDGSSMIEPRRVAELIGSRDPQQRVKAIQAMVAFELPDRVTLLPQMVEREKDSFVRSELARGLATLGEAGESLLLGMVADRDARVRQGVAEALSALGSTESLAALVPLLLDTDERVRRTTAEALNKLGRDSLLRILGGLVGAPEMARRDAAVHALAMARLPEALPLLKRALSDSVEGIRAKAREGLELLAQKGVLEADAILEEFQAHVVTRPGVSTASVVAPSLLTGEGLEPVVTTNNLNDDDPEMRIAEIKKAVRAKAYERAPELAARIKIEKDRNVLSCLLLALGRLKAREFTSVLRRFLRSDNARVRANAIEGIGLMEDRSAWPELSGFLEDPSSRVRVNAILALRGCPGHEPHRLLAGLLSQPDAVFRRSALFGLLELRDAGAVELLAQSLVDPDAAVRETAMEYLGILKSEGMEPAARAYEQAHAQGLRPPASVTGFSRSSRSGRVQKFALDELLYFLKEVGGSDLHLNVGVEPAVRLHGELRRVRSLPLTPDDTKRMIYTVLNEEQIVRLEKTHSLDFSYSIAGIARFRVNAFREVRGYKGVFRLVPMTIPTMDDLMLPPIFRRFCKVKQGLVLVTGPTGSGKSTTLASMINDINTTERKHIITVEDPIEFVHNHRLSLVSQRELGVHAQSFAGALRDALREDPNVILVGEMRDLETISLAVTAAETGHLVLATLHTYSAAQSINRIVDVFPPTQQEQARAQLSTTIHAIVSQRLIPTVTGDSRVLALEVMVNNPAIANLIREGKTEQLYSVLQVSRESGMMTLDTHLAQLVGSGKVDRSVALENAMDKKSFMASLK